MAGNLSLKAFFYKHFFQVAWIWALFFAYITPEVQSFLRSFRFVLFKSWEAPKWHEFTFVATMECLSAIGKKLESLIPKISLKNIFSGMAILVYHGLAQLDSSHALALTHCVCLVPSILLMMTREQERQTGLKMAIGNKELKCENVRMLMQFSPRLCCDSDPALRSDRLAAAGLPKRRT